MRAVMVDAAQRRLVDRHNEMVWLAWHTAALSQAKKLPKLSSLFMQYPRARPQTFEEQDAVMRMIANTFGSKQ